MALAYVLCLSACLFEVSLGLAPPLALPPPSFRARPSPAIGATLPSGRGPAKFKSLGASRFGGLAPKTAAPFSVAGLDSLGLESQLKEILASTSRSIAAKYYEAEVLGISKLENGDPSLGALVELLGASRSSPFTLDKNELVGDWTLAYSNDLPSNLREELVRHIGYDFFDLSVILSVSNTGDMTTRAVISLLNGARHVMTLKDVMVQHIPSSSLTSGRKDGDRMSVQMMYQSSDLLVLRQGYPHRLGTEGLAPAKTEVWRRSPEPSAKIPLSTGRTSLWRFGIPLDAQSPTGRLRSKLAPDVQREITSAFTAFVFMGVLGVTVAAIASVWRRRVEVLDLRAPEVLEMATKRHGEEGLAAEGGLLGPELLEGRLAVAAFAGSVNEDPQRRNGFRSGSGRSDGRGPSATRRRAGSLPSALHGVIGKKQLKQTINWCLRNRGKDKTVQLLDSLKELGFSWATRAGVSLGPLDLSTPASKVELCDATSQRALDLDERFQNGDVTVVEKFNKVTDEWAKTAELVKNASMRNFKDNDPGNSVYMMATSGARGNISQVRQLLAMRGLMADATGQLIDVPIKSNLREGMTASEMLISGNGARKGIIDKGLMTADSGYLYRRLDFAACSVVVRAKDCGTKATTPVTLRGHGNVVASLSERIRARVLARDVEDPSSGELLYGRGHLLAPDEAVSIEDRWKECDKQGIDVPTIHIRSPLTCTLASGICGCCYGEDMSRPGTCAQIGYPAGTIAAQSMGEPGTQMTMQTFHTGGAASVGGGGDHVVAESRGVVGVWTIDDGGEQGSTIRRDSEDAVAFGRWERLPTGDTICKLSRRAKLEVVSNSKVVQTAELAAGSFLRVQHGQEITRGQVIYDLPAPDDAEEEDDDDRDYLWRPVKSDHAGEVVVVPAPAEDGDLPAGSSQLWVLQGSFPTFERAATCTLSVQNGDVVTEGASLAADWSGTRVAGVPRFCTTGADGAGGASSSMGAGWRRVEWNASSSDDLAAGSGVSGAITASSTLEKGLSLRTDFDWFSLPADQISEYMVKGQSLPPALLPRDLAAEETARLEREKSWSKASARSARYANIALRKASERAQRDLLEVPEVGVQTFKPTGQCHGASHGGGCRPVSMVCAPPSSGVASVLFPVTRTVHPDHVLPRGGLLLQTMRDDGSRELTWCLEEVHTMRLKEEVLRALACKHGEHATAESGDEITQAIEVSYIPDLPKDADEATRFTYDGFDVSLPIAVPSISGYVCAYVRVPEAPETPVCIQEAGSVLRREAWDRVLVSSYLERERTPDDEASGLPHVECVIKPGHVVFARSTSFDETWFAKGKCGVHLHQKLVPAGMGLVPGVAGLRRRDGPCVVELLDDPTEREVVRVLVRAARGLVVPADQPPELPHVSGSTSSWLLPYENGRVVESSGPFAAAYEVTYSVARHVEEPHCATVVPSSSAGVGEGAPLGAAAAAIREAGEMRASSSGSCNFSVTPTRQWELGELTVVQHCPRQPAPQPPPQSGAIGSEVAASEPQAGGAWQDTPPQHVVPQSTTGGERTPVVRRQVASPVAGVVSRIRERPPLKSVGGLASAIVDLVRPEDCIRLRVRRRPTVLVGALVRRGDALCEAADQAEDRAPCPGQVLLVEQDEEQDDGTAGDWVLTLRRARVYLVSGDGEVRVQTGALVNKGDLLGREVMVVRKTSDIVQGLPRITKLFEATDGILQQRLDALYEQQVAAGATNWAAAVGAKDQLQREIVGDISSAYLEQGVNINGRHVEVVVRKMTGKCRVVATFGKFPIPVGTLVEYQDVEAAMVSCPSGRAEIEPMVRGITRVGVDSHVLVGMSFREADRVLTHDVTMGPVSHELMGVKENLMIGKRIAVGTNSRPTNRLWGERGTESGTGSPAEENVSPFRGLYLGKIPEHGAPIDLDSCPTLSQHSVVS